MACEGEELDIALSKLSLAELNRRTFCLVDGRVVKRVQAVCGASGGEGNYDPPIPQTDVTDLVADLAALEIGLNTVGATTVSLGEALTNETTARSEGDQALQDQVDALTIAVAGGLKLPEPFTPAGSYPSTYDGSPVMQGSTFSILVAGTVGTTDVDAGDLLIALVDTPSTSNDAHWAVQEGNKGQATESLKGVARIATQAIVENSATTNDTDVVSAKKFWQGFAVGITLSSFLSAVRGTVLTGYAVGANTALAASDTILGAMGKIQAQLNAVVSTAGAALVKASNLSDLTDAKTARVNIGMEVGRTVGDANYTLVASDRTVYTTAAFTAARTFTLAKASDYNAGTVLHIVDMVGAISSTNTLTIAPNGTDAINGSNTSLTFSIRYGYLQLVCNGSNGWVLRDMCRDISDTYVARTNLGLTTALIVPIWKVIGDQIWTDMPAAATLAFGTNRKVVSVDITGFKQVRLVLNKSGVAGFAGSKMIARYKTGSLSATAGDYSDLGTSEVSVAVDVATTVLTSAWTDIATGAKGDVLLAIVGSGGNGTVDPTFGSCELQFR